MIGLLFDLCQKDTIRFFVLIFLKIISISFYTIVLSHISRQTSAIFLHDKIHKPTYVLLFPKIKALTLTILNFFGYETCSFVDIFSDDRVGTQSMQRY